MLPLTVLIFIRNLIFRNKTLVINGQIWYYKFRLNWNSNQPMRRRVGMADEADSKSVVGNHVRVQVPRRQCKTPEFIRGFSFRVAFRVALFEILYLREEELCVLFEP